MVKERTRKLQHLWEDVSRNQNNIEKIKFRRVETATYTVTKKPQVLKILEKYPMNADHKDWIYAVEISVPFENMPSWALSGVKVIPVFYSEEEEIDPIVYGDIICEGSICTITVESGTNWFFHSVNQKWKYIEESTESGVITGGYYVYLASIIAYLQPVNPDGSIQPGVYLPLYLDFDILIENTRRYSLQQGYKI